MKYPHFYLFIIFLQLRVLFSQQRIVHSRREGRPTPKESHFLFYILKVANQILNFGQQHEPNKTLACCSPWVTKSRRQLSSWTIASKEQVQKKKSFRWWNSASYTEGTKYKHVWVNKGMHCSKVYHLPLIKMFTLKGIKKCFSRQLISRQDHET